MSFMAKLDAAWKINNSLVCVGLDPLLEKIPISIRAQKKPIFSFNKAIIDQTAKLVCAYKPQIAYYSSQQAESELEETIDYIHTNYPDIPVILDAKRNDIGSTAEQYAREAFDRYKADAVTLGPYMGTDSLAPFIERADKGIIILCRTSNPGAFDIQELDVEGKPLYQRVAELAASKWNSHKNLSLVVGATYPEQMRIIREIAGEIPFLVPGIGAQGGDIESSILNGQTKNGTGLMINSSRGVIYASSNNDFAEAAKDVVIKMNNAINPFRNSKES